MQITVEVIAPPRTRQLTSWRSLLAALELGIGTGRIALPLAAAAS